MPKPAKPNDDLPTSIMLPREIKALLRKEAIKQDRNVSQIIRNIIRAWFDFQKKTRGDLDNPEFKETK